jgi:FKBP-type peptidyl-prolyl cis-trans isomerase FkpA
MLVTATAITGEGIIIMRGKVMRKLVIATLILCVASPVFAARPLKTEEQKTLYAVGLVIAGQLSSFNLTPAELRLVKQGLTDGVRGRKAKVDYAKYSKKSLEMGIARRDAHGKKLEAQAAAFVEAAAGETGAVKSKSGTVYRSLREGEGERPAATDTVKIHYRSTLIDGREMDSTYKRGEPDQSKANGFIDCLNEGIQMMKPGGRARLVCPPETALGSEGYGLVPPNATLVYDVELVGIVDPKNDPKTVKPE